MRADRLLAILMILQARGKITARELAEELEVSERTVYRDMQGLSTAGVPVFAERGPGGGCALVEDYRTTLTGLKEDEVRALFMLSIPAPLAELGVSRELRSALWKLSAALPASFRRDEVRVRQRIHLDSVSWSGMEEPAPHLQTLYQALWQDFRVHIAYRSEFETRFRWLVEPYGLVAKASAWHLVCAREGRMHVYRVAQIIEAELSDEHFDRSSDFDLAHYWSEWCEAYKKSRPSYSVITRVSPELFRWLPLHFGDQIRQDMAQAGPPDAKGWVTITLPFESLAAARGSILGFGRAIEVLEPQALRASILDFARQIAEFYEESVNNPI